MTAATIRVRRPSGALATFAAESVDLSNGLVHAVGYWCDDRHRRRRSYSWGHVVEIRWTRERVMA